MMMILKQSSDRWFFSFKICLCIHRANFM